MGEQRDDQGADGRVSFPRQLEQLHELKSSNRQSYY